MFLQNRTFDQVPDPLVSYSKYINSMLILAEFQLAGKYDLILRTDLDSFIAPGRLSKGLALKFCNTNYPLKNRICRMDTPQLFNPDDWPGWLRIKKCWTSFEICCKATWFNIQWHGWIGKYVVWKCWADGSYCKSHHFSHEMAHHSGVYKTLIGFHELCHLWPKKVSSRNSPLLKNVVVV